jgi:hypothetical protein
MIQKLRQKLADWIRPTRYLDPAPPERTVEFCGYVTNFAWITAPTSEDDVALCTKVSKTMTIQ